MTDDQTDRQTYRPRALTSVAIGGIKMSAGAQVEAHNSDPKPDSPLPRRYHASQGDWLLALPISSSGLRL